MTDVLALAGHAPAVQAALVIGGTFVLEDATTVLTAMAARTGVISHPLALCSLYAGIVLGDLGLYGLGMLGARVRWARRLLPAAARAEAQDWLRGRVFRVVFASRFLPGARLPTYTACGFLGADLRRFLGAAVVATSAWTTLLFGLSLVAGEVLIRYLGPWRWVGAAGLAAAVVLIGRGLAHLRTVRT